ncbi:tannase/feruloyl esterase family alpha/beta hydrolase [Parafrankia sp. EUN1f]|uniref:tannase/feruloyl esterase family alpha/beta hydrolase n=1 Tax=Parafrankia sp. EUN1f TaxID=102897 RepID=UPI0001C45AB1|nr:tannase/feruloyl esterase family alpha/beta hydrolase [Parafrankia sp. EUN1f]EFC81948.1 Tannase [Parafrankia sp. EUN1f]
MRKPARRLLTLFTVASTVAALTVQGMLLSPASAATGTGCKNVAQPTVAGATVQSMSTSDKATDILLGVPAHCEVTLSLTHPGDDDKVQVTVWLPTSTWNGRFQGTGGGGYATSLQLGGISLGESVATLPSAVKEGYAAAATDSGIGFNPLSPSAWALKADGTVNTGLLTNFAHRSIHDMTVAAKQVVASFYGQQASYSYWNGCSTGGRQGMMEAQRYPADYDGIMASAPAINWDTFVPAELWPQVVMNDLKTYPSACKFKVFTDAAIAACNQGDTVAGGLINQPETCNFDPRSLIGKVVFCDLVFQTITANDAEVVRRIWEGPKTADGQQVWNGLPKGAAIDMVAGTTSDLLGRRSGSPNSLIADWVKYFLLKQPSADIATITPSQLLTLIGQSQTEYKAIIGTDNPDLTAFKDRGGKIIGWHGLADQLIFPQGTVKYYQRVQATMGGAASTNDFYRLFLAPGVGHCGIGGNGPVPTNVLASLVNWVENGQAPATLTSSASSLTEGTITRNICLYPEIARYNGQGDRKVASSYHCAA